MTEVRDTGMGATEGLAWARISVHVLASTDSPSTPYTGKGRGEQRQRGNVMGKRMLK